MPPRATREPVSEAPTAAMKLVIEIMKGSQKRLNPEKLKAHVQKIMDRAMGGGRLQKGWKCEIGNDGWMTPKFQQGEYRYLVKLNFECNPKRERTADALRVERDNIIKVIGTAGAQPGWTVAFIDGKVADANKDDRLPRAVGYVPVEIAPDWEKEFEGIYEREAQIEIIMSAIQAGITSDFQDRFHCALIGDPACGKTETLRRVKKVLGEEAVLEYDATATTQAGAIQDLDNREELPRVLIVEEIEKTDEQSLRWLLSVMDHRAEIRKVAARTNIQRETKMLTLATVNDYKLFRKLMFGALASRFTYHLHFPKPDRALLQRILEREVARVGGKKAWIKPTLDYAVKEKIYGPRKITAVCLCGKDQLLSGEYQAKLAKCNASNFLREIEKRKKED